MAGQTNHGTTKYAHLDRLSTDALEEFLRADIESPDGDNDEAIFHILEVIEQREKENPMGRLSDVDKAWADFQKYYNTSEGEGLSLYPTGDGEPDEPDGSATAPIISIGVARPHRWLKNALIAAAAIAALMVGMVGAQAAGIDVFGAIGRWTDETFHFVTSTSGAVQGNTDITPSAEPTSYYDTLQEALEECGISEKLTPMWYPQGLEMSDPIISSGDFGNKIFCEYKGLDDKFCNIQIWRYDLTSDLELHTFEKDGLSVEKYTSAGKDFYIMSNVDTSTATWSDGYSLVLNITGNISKDNIKAMIDSIGG